MISTHIARCWTAALFLFALTACGAPSVDLDTWRQSESVARPAAERAALQADIAEVESLRAADKLTEARELALRLIAEHPDDAHLAFLASRAESDGLVLFAERDKPVRNAAAASALDYAQRADDGGEDSPAARAQFAWALGSSTHLQGMTDRSDHAARTVEVANSVLEVEPEEPTALATMAVVNWRLETLPWIAKVMAVGRPDSSLEEAISLAQRAVAATPSRENRLILAKCLLADDQDEAARTVLDEALAAPVQFPRDTALEKSIQALRDDS